MRHIIIFYLPNKNSNLFFISIIVVMTQIYDTSIKIPNTFQNYTQDLKYYLNQLKTLKGLVLSN